MLVLHRTIIMAANGAVTDDFSTVWSALQRFRQGIPVYNETYYFVDPHYLYSPGGTLLLSPITFIGDFSAGRWLYIALNVICIIAALALLTRFIGFRLQHPLWPATITFIFLTEATINTLVFTNINGVLLLAETVFLLAMLRRRWILAGICIGLAITIKPIFLPLLFIPLVHWRSGWRTIVTGLAIPIAFNVVGWFVIPGANDYVHRTIPYLGQVRNFANSSIPGFGAFYDVPSAYVLAVRGVFAVIIIVGLVALWRMRAADEFMWSTTTAALLLTGVFLLSSLGQMYYSLLLVPVFFTLGRRYSVLHNPLAWVAAYCFFAADKWVSTHWLENVYWTDVFRATVGWSLFIITISGSALAWSLAQRRMGSTVNSPSRQPDDHSDTSASSNEHEPSVSEN